MEELRRIAAIHDISGFGKCSLTVALPILSASGVECACLPTALLSTHTGGFTDFTFKDLSSEMMPIAQHWKREGVDFDGIYSGYLASADQAKLLESIVDLIGTDKTKVIVDPVMADNGEYYSNHGDDMCVAFRKLCKRADIITPNITEAALLTGLQYEAGPHSDEYIGAILEGLKELCNGVIAITGICPDDEHIGAIAYDVSNGKQCLSVGPKVPGVFYGTGDVYASSFAALIVRGADIESANAEAITLVSNCIERTVMRNRPRHLGIDFEGALPEYIANVSKVFEK